MGLAGLMHIGAAVAGALEARERAAMRAELMQASAGLLKPVRGVHVWSLLQAPLKEEVGRVSGTAPNFALLAGLPFSRIRAAIPEALLEGSADQSIGHRSGLGAARFRSTGNKVLAALGEKAQNAGSKSAGGGSASATERWSRRNTTTLC